MKNYKKTNRASDYQDYVPTLVDLTTEKNQERIYINFSEDSFKRMLIAIRLIDELNYNDVVIGFRCRGFLSNKKLANDFYRMVQFWEALIAGNEKKAESISQAMEDAELRDLTNNYIYNKPTMSVLKEHLAESNRNLDEENRSFDEGQLVLELPSKIDVIKFCKFAWLLEGKLVQGDMQSRPPVKSDSVISRFFSFRNGLLTLPATEESDTAKLKAVKEKQEKSVLYKMLTLTFNPPKSYVRLWNDENHKTDEDRVVALLEDYTKGYGVTGALKLFFTGHWHHHHTDAIRQLLLEVKEKKVTVDDIMKKLNAIEKKSGSLQKRINFIILKRALVDDVDMQKREEKSANSRLV